MLIALLIACSPIENPASEAVLAAQLEAITVDATAPTGSGTLSVSGDAADFTLTAGETTVNAHSPAQSDLSAWADEEVTLTVGEASEDWTGQIGAELTDTDGLVWLAEPGTSSTLADARFGAGFADYGQSQGEELRGDYIVTLFSVVFQTDAGEVEATAGAPALLTLGGLDYRATVVTAYTAEQAPGTPEYDCMGKPDLLSYELVRVAEPAEWAPLVRPAAAAVANVAGCGEE